MVVIGIEATLNLQLKLDASAFAAKSCFVAVLSPLK